MRTISNKTVIHLYIDANVYLTFYHLSSDDLEELKKLNVLIRTKQVQLHLPEQTLDEFKRNREVKIADALKRFREAKLNNLFPQMCKEFPEYKEMRNAIEEFESSKSALVEKLLSAIHEERLAADSLINDLLETASSYDTTDELLVQAMTRFDLGKPPGKNKSYGDALNWVTLLENIPNGEDLYFVSDDKDFFSEIDPAFFKSYLTNEWKGTKRSSIRPFRRISEFFKGKFPQIQLASEYEKDHLISQLTAVKSFAGARRTLTKLSEFEEYSTEQLNDFVQACIGNNQVYWIKDDVDIEEMIAQIIGPNRGRIQADLLEQFDEIFEYDFN